MRSEQEIRELILRGNIELARKRHEQRLARIDRNERIMVLIVIVAALIALFA